MMTQVVDVFAPPWISSAVPVSSNSYAGRLMCHAENTTRRSAQITRRRDEKLLKQTSLLKGHTRSVFKNTHPYHRKDIDDDCSHLQALILNHVDALSDTENEEHGDWGESIICRVGDDDELQNELVVEDVDSVWTRRDEIPDLLKDNDRDANGDCSTQPQDAGEIGRKSKAERVWRKQVSGLIQKEDDTNIMETFAPIWMKKPKDNQDDEELREPFTRRSEKPSQKCCASTSDTGITSRSGGNVMDFPKTASPSLSAGRLMKEKLTGSRELESGMEGTEVSSRGSMGDACSPVCDEIKPSQASERCSSKNAYTQTPTDLLLRQFELVSYEKELDGFIFLVLLNAAASVLVEDVIYVTLKELEDECVATSQRNTSQITLSDVNESLNWLSGEFSFQSDGSFLSGRSSGLNDDDDELITSETPPWASDRRDSIGEESLIDACLQQDALEHGYAASVAVLDGGKEDGLLTDVMLIWTSDDDLYTSGDSSLALETNGDDVQDEDCQELCE